MIPIHFDHGGGYAAIIKANNLEEAAQKSAGLLESSGEKIRYGIYKTADLGDFESFDYVIVEYWE